MYSDIYNLIYDAISGGEAITPYMELCIDLLACAGCVCCVALPFVVIYGLSIWVANLVRS